MAAATAAMVCATAPAGATRSKPPRKFLGDESGGELAGAPARMLHDRREKRDVVANALDGEGVERVGLSVDRGKPGLGVGDELGDHRIVIERNLAALGDAGVVAHGDAVAHAFGGRPIANEPADRGCEIAVRILGIDAALDRPAVELYIACLSASGSPEAMRIICSTRSMPVTSSVTGCST